ncbi:hypothetical protein [Erwinia psidii]|uniref:hypothetical protein n=1 Tax=Erwinia psidii TaxID=69224 RepID=UPI001F35A843|nr:hypothetical protein [Erwinia psidii]
MRSLAGGRQRRNHPGYQPGQRRYPRHWPVTGRKETCEAITFADAVRLSWAKTPDAQRARLLENGTR